MSYSSIEISSQSGSPVELYTFSIGTDVYRYTTGEEAVTLDSLDYSPVEVDRTTIIVSDEQSSDAITITIPASNSLVRRFINVVPGQTGTLTIQRYHRTDDTDEVILIYAGIVRAVAFTLNGLMAEISVQPLTAGLSRTIPRMVFSGTCNHVLYDGGCKVSSTSYQYNGNVGVVSENTITVVDLSHATRPDGWATGGFVSGPSGVDFRLIIDHTGSTLTLPVPFPSTVGAGSAVQVFAGCGHDIEVCKDKFDNVVNFGGFHWVPRENVFVKGMSQGS